MLLRRWPNTFHFCVCTLYECVLFEFNFWLTFSCTAPPALKGPFITPVIISEDFEEVKLFIALAWDCDWDDIDENDAKLLLFPTPDDDDDNEAATDEGVTSICDADSLPLKPLLSNGVVWEGMEGFPALWLETEFSEEFIAEPILFTNTLLDTLAITCPDTWLLNAFDWLFESEKENTTS